MKSSDGFNARRLRSKRPGNWRFRFGAAIAALLLALGVMLSMAGVATLLGNPPQVAGLDTSVTGAVILTVVGLLVLYVGIWVWRRCRARMRRSRELNLAPHLMKKHD